MTVQAYGNSPLRLRMAFRFQPATNGQPFAILDPSVWEFSVPEDQFLRLYVAVKRGLHGVRWPSGKGWVDFYQGRREVPSLLPAAVGAGDVHVVGVAGAALLHVWFAVAALGSARGVNHRGRPFEWRRFWPGVASPRVGSPTL